MGTYDTSRNESFGTPEDDEEMLDWLDEARSNSDLFLLSGWARERIKAFRTENAALLARAEEAERERDALKAFADNVRRWLPDHKHDRGWYIAKSVLLFLAGAKEVP